MAHRTKRSFHFVTLLLVLYWLTLFCLTHTQKTITIGSGSSDKVVHFLAYAGLSFMLAWSLVRTRELSLGVCAIVMFVTAIYAIVDESTQAFIPRRHADVLDVTANILGALAGLLTIVLIAAIRNYVTSSRLVGGEGEV